MTALIEHAERLVTITIEKALDDGWRYKGRPVDPLRYSWRRSHSDTAYPMELREPPTLHDVKTCPKCGTEHPTWVRVCPTCRVINGATW